MVEKNIIYEIMLLITMILKMCYKLSRIQGECEREKEHSAIVEKYEIHPNKVCIHFCTMIIAIFKFITLC